MTSSYTKKGAGKNTNNKLHLDQQIKLVDYMREHYTASGKNDTEFATVAESALGFKITYANVNYARTALDIPSNVTRQVAQIKGSPRLARMEGETEIIKQVLKELLLKVGEPEMANRLG